MFALFHYNEDGDHKSRYSLYNRRVTDSCVIIEEVKAGLLYLEENNVKPVPTIIKIQKRSGVGTRLTVWWETTWKVVFNGKDVPVLDFLNKEFFCRKPTITIYTDAQKWCEFRRQEQLHLFDEMKQVIESMIPRKFPEWILYQTDDKIIPSEVKKVGMYSVETQTDPYSLTNIVFSGNNCIPGFIAEALVIKAILKEDTCPISMNLYNDCKTVTVTNCYHCFDEDSLDNWLLIKDDCPVCNTVLHSFVIMNVKI